MRGKEIRSLTGLRGIAASWIVIYHMHQADGLAGYPGELVRHGYLAVDIFFALSGFVMALSYESLFRERFDFRIYMSFLVRRLARVWPLYAIMTCLYAAVLAAGFGSTRITPLALVHLLPLNLAMVQAWGIGESIDHPAWSISTEFAAYLLFPVLAWLTLFARPAIGFVSGLACVAALAIIAFLAQAAGVGNGRFDLLDSGTAWPLLRCLAEFSLGLLAYRALSLPRTQRLVAGPLASWLLPAALLVLLGFPGTDFWVVLLVPLLLMQFAVADSFAVRLLTSAPVYFLGCISYAIYLIHWMLLPGRRADHLLAVWLPPAVADTVVLCAVYGLLLGSATLGYRFIELPSRRIIRRLGRPLERNRPRLSPAAPAP